MVDLVALSGLFGEAFGAVARFEPLDDVEKEKVYRELKSAGHELLWASETRLREFRGKAWKPVTEPDSLGKPTIFTDRLGELVLVHRPPPMAA